MWIFLFPKWLVLDHVLIHFLQCYTFKSKGSHDNARGKTNIEILTKHTKVPWNWTHCMVKLWVEILFIYFIIH